MSLTPLAGKVKNEVDVPNRPPVEVQDPSKPFNLLAELQAHQFGVLQDEVWV